MPSRRSCAASDQLLFVAGCGQDGYDDGVAAVCANAVIGGVVEVEAELTPIDDGGGVGDAFSVVIPTEPSGSSSAGPVR